MKSLLRFWRDDRGNTAIIVGISLAVITAVGAFAIDHGRLKDTQARLQAAADAGALAGMNKVFKGSPLVVDTNIKQVVKQIVAEAAANVKWGNNNTGINIPLEDITFGKWNKDTKTIDPVKDPASSPSPGTIDTCNVKVYRSADVDTGLPTNITGTTTFGAAKEVGVQATAYLPQASAFW